MLNCQLLHDYAEKFFGYGNPNSELWFIGIEEAGGRCERVVEDRLKLWSDHQFGRAPFVDGYKFHQSLRDCNGELLDRLFHDPVPAQTTWDQLIRVQLVRKGAKSIEPHDVKDFRKTKWARSTSSSCLLELLPLPSPSVKTWNYGEWISPDCDSATAELFQTQPVYQKRFGKIRAQAINQLIAEHRPRVVIFYGSRMKRWSEIAGFPWRNVEMDSAIPARFRRRENRLYAVVRHPAAHGLNGDYFQCVGERIRSLGFGDMEEPA
jgi:hypothetical protein